MTKVTAEQVMRLALEALQQDKDFLANSILKAGIGMVTTLIPGTAKQFTSLEWAQLRCVSDKPYSIPLGTDYILDHIAGLDTQK